MDQYIEKTTIPAAKSHNEEHEKILAALRKEFDYDTGSSGKDYYRSICKQIEEIENPSKDAPQRPHTQQDKERLLAEKALYENVPELMNRPHSFANQVHNGVKNIVKHKLNKNIPELPQKIICSMRRWGHDAQWINDKMNRKSSRLHDLLNTKNPRTSISAFYLEALCLIFLADPYDFLGLRKPETDIDIPGFHIPPFNPILPISEAQTAYYHFIMNRFADPRNEDKLLRLRITTKIAKLKTEKYQIFQNIVSHIPTLSATLTAPYPADWSGPLNEQVDMYLKHATIKYLLDDNPDQNQPYYIIAEAGQFLRYLTRFDTDRLKTLAHLANGSDDVWHILHAILIIGNFPVNNISLHGKIKDFVT